MTITQKDPSQNVLITGIHRVHPAEPSLKNISRSREMEIWEDFRNGNESAFILIYKLYYNLLLSYGCQFTGDREVVKDAIQDLYVDLRNKGQELPVLRYSMKFYLFKSLKNNLLQYLRKKKVADRYYYIFAASLAAEDESQESRIIRTQEHTDLVRKLHRGLNNLTNRQKEVLFYLYYENFSYSEIQGLMHLRCVKSVRNLVYCAVKALKGQISNLPFG